MASNHVKKTCSHSQTALNIYSILLDLGKQNFKSSLGIERQLMLYSYGKVFNQPFIAANEKCLPNSVCHGQHIWQVSFFFPLACSAISLMINNGKAGFLSVCKEELDDQLVMHISFYLSNLCIFDFIY